jgi:hypothetical protein
MVRSAAGEAGSRQVKDRMNHLLFEPVEMLEKVAS